MRLRRKLSRIFHRDSPESGLACVSPQRGNAIAQPGSNLPVAAYPAVAAVHIDQQPRGNSFEQFHVVDQAAAGEAAFDQVVAQQAVFGKTAFACRLEGLHVVDPFADETALPKQVVIEIAGLERIGIDSRIARHQAAETAAMRLGHGGGYPRLKHGVARNHHPRMRIDFRLVQGMGRTTDQLPAGIARQSRVAVQSDHVADRAELRQVADRGTKGIGRAGSQQPVEGRQLAPFSLFSHPCALLPIPLPRPMQEVEDPRAISTIALVEPLDLRAGQLQQARIAGHRFLIGIGKIAQQGEPQIVVLIGQVAQFELLHEFPHRLLGGQ